MPNLAQVESWNPCPPLPGCISVNIGDPLQFWSDGVLKSNYHRVRMPLPGESKVCSSARVPLIVAAFACQCCMLHMLAGCRCSNPSWLPMHMLDFDRKEVAVHMRVPAMHAG